MREPSVRSSRLAIAAVLAAAALAAASFVAGRATAPLPAPTPTTGRATPVPVPVATTAADAVPARTWGRADLIALAQRAADTFAAGTPATEATVAGQRFELAIPFGCAGPDATDDEPMRWRYDAAAGALRISVAPVRWSAADWGLPPPPGEADAAAEGFWIARPWTASEECPAPGRQAPPPGAEPITLPGQTLAVARFAATDRPPRPYEVVLRTAPDRLPDRGLRLRLAGRLDTAPGGGAVRCVQPGGSEQRPVCAVAVRLDEVRVENRADDAVLATWPAVRAR